jgi:hypothetical protein
MEHRLERIQVLAAPVEEVFRFFEDAGNLEEMTPPFLRFQILSPRPIAMVAGARIEYRIRISGVPVRWETLIEEYDPPRRFVDVQLHGPYRRWRHVHEFRSLGVGTEMRDEVTYELPRVPCRGWVQRGWVGPRLEEIFDYRRDRIGARYASPASRYAT